MNPLAGLIGVVLIYVVGPAVADWWRDRRQVVDLRHERAASALRQLCDTVDVPPFHIVMPAAVFYDAEAEGWMA